MRKRRAATITAAAAIGLVALQATPASACHPEVVATNICLDGVPAISVTASAWETDRGDDWRVNNSVRIDAWGPHTSTSMSGAFVSPNFQAQVVFEVPGAVGDTLTVRATAVAPWGPNGEYGFAGTYRETTITVQPACPMTPPTQDDSSTDEERPPAEAPTGSEAPEVAVPAPDLSPDAAPVQVLGASVSRVPAQVPGTAPTLAFTGDHTGSLTVFGAAALVVGALGLGISRRSTKREDWRPLP